MQVSHKKGIEEKDSNPLRELLSKYLPFWRLFAGMFLGFVIVAFIYMRITAKVYETTAAVLVKDEKKGMDESNLMEQLDLFGSKKLVENEIEIIKSRMLMHQVVEELYLYAPVTCKGTLTSRSGYVFSPVLVQAQYPDSLIEEKKVYFSFDSAKNEVLINGQKHPVNQWFSDGANMIRFIGNPHYVVPEDKLPLYFSVMDIRKATDDILLGMKVAQATKLASVIDITFRDAVPKRAEDILNNLIAAYNKAAINDKNAQSANTLRFINDRLKLVVSELDSVEAGIQRYKAKEGIVDISMQGQSYLENVGINDQKVSAINVQLAVMDEVEKYVQSKSDEPGIVPSTVGVTDGVLTDLLTKLSGLEVQYEGMRKTTAENNPLLIGIRNEIDRIKPSILENIHNQRKSLQASLASLSGNSDRYASIIQRLPQKERGLIAISRQQTVKNAIYSFLLQKREETALTYNSNIADTRIVDNAITAVKPVSPKGSLVYPFAAILALALAAGIVSGREVLNPNVIFRSEIQEHTMFPIIGEISQEAGKKRQTLVIEDGKRTRIAEQFRHLRTSLGYIGIGGRKKRLLITSSTEGEGKSFIAANLAVTLSLTNKKVVLLEMDLRKPKLSKIFNINATVGLTDYLMGESKDANYIIKSTAVSKYLFVVPCGDIPANPSELLSNGRLEELLAFLDNSFDYIIIDSAPVNPVTDAYIISPHCDATIYVVRHAVTPKAFVKTLDENTRLKNISIVFNGIRKRGDDRFGYGYGLDIDGGYANDDERGKDTRPGKKSLWKK